MNLSYFLNNIMLNDYLWFVIPIFFIGIITDKYQEEFSTSVGNAISNGTLIIFTGFSWIQLITGRTNYPIAYIYSQFLFAIFIIIYGFSIIASGFKRGIFATRYGRIRVVTYVLIYFTTMVYIPKLYNFFTLSLFVFIFPIYYLLISKLIKIMPNATKIKPNKHIKRKNIKI